MMYTSYSCVSCVILLIACVAPLYAHGPSLAERGIDPSDVNVPITVVGDAELPSMLDEADVVVTD